MSELKGATIKTVYYWDPVYGWISILDREKLEEARKRFEEERKV